MAKKIAAGGAVLVAVFLYALFGNRSATTAAGGIPATTAAPADNQGQLSSDTPEASGSAAAAAGGSNPPSGSQSGSAANTPGGQYADGTYAGSVADAVYGPMQVQAVISGGKLADVKFLQYPDSPGHTSEVSGFALPQLRQEAIAAQSAEVDVVSGATQTSEAFQQSLGAALQQAS